MAHAELDRLKACLNFALDALRREMDDSQLPPLSQYSSVEHPLDDINYLPSTRLFEARRLSLACLGELKNLIQSPMDKCVEERGSLYGVACTGVLIQAGIIDYLAGVPNPSQGVPVIELAAKLELDSHKLIPILRCSTANGWVRETRDSSFALNRCARTFIKGRAGRKFNIAAPGLMTTIEKIPHWVTKSEWKLSRSSLQTPFQIAFKTPLSLFPWLVEHPECFIPVSDHIQVCGDMSTPSIVSDYPWAQLETPVIVDCGGGEGSLVSAIIDAHPFFRAIVQDMENMVALTGSLMEERRPREMESGVLKVEAHDIFQPQPRIGDEYSFTLRHVLHDWPDEEASTILSHLARALGPKSKILIIDLIAVPNVDATVTTTFNPLPHEHPDYLIPSHFGSASKIVNRLSMHMLTMLNSSERSMCEWEELVKRCGLRITNVYPLRAHASIIECAA
ncbi:S-adenosyl-L-methionine-dependent methyltransferase [Rhizopogon salebrosus TDB-379]|nr:S-adenosyl-L-methionine-dependent methyltransferase [Rhizopogon salebrosus TDB-379]